MMNQERLHKIIANRGYTSRRNAEKLILNGDVKVNGQVVTELGTKFDHNAKIQIKDKELKINNEKVYYLFNKPRMVVTTMYDPKGRKTITDFFKNVKQRVYPVGRLDYDVAGAIFVTNDGNFANFIMHPRYEFEKVYQAQCRGKISREQLQMLKKGIIIEDGHKTAAKNVKLVSYNEKEDYSVIELTIVEGHKHHVKNMLIAIETNLLKLKRIQIEFIDLGDLPIGQYRPLKIFEVKKLYGIYNAMLKKPQF